jgi:anti-sigma factor RsiW
MMAASKKVLDQEPSEIEMLLPFHAAGTLSTRDARRVEDALAGDPELARQFAVIREEYTETISLNESLGAPSVRAMQKLFAAIDAEPVRKPSLSISLSARISEFFARLSPRALAWSASLGAVALLLQAGVIGAVLMKNQTASFETASLSMNEPSSGPITRDLGSSVAPPRALVRFAPEARIADITSLLDKYQASIVGSANGDMFRLQFKAMGREEAASLLKKLEGENIVKLALATP